MNPWEEIQRMRQHAWEWTKRCFGDNKVKLSIMGPEWRRYRKNRRDAACAKIKGYRVRLALRNKRWITDKLIRKVWETKPPSAIHKAIVAEAWMNEPDWQAREG